MTYQFFHEIPFHLLANMLFLWTAGPIMERKLGGQRFFYHGWRLWRQHTTCVASFRSIDIRESSAAVCFYPHRFLYALRATSHYNTIVLHYSFETVCKVLRFWSRLGFYNFRGNGLATEYWTFFPFRGMYFGVLVVRFWRRRVSI